MIIFRTAATYELVDLVDAIHTADPVAAARFEENVRRTLARLEAFPLSGVLRRFRNPNARGMRVATVRRYPQYVVMYLPLPNGIEVCHIVSGRRNLGRVVAND